MDSAAQPILDFWGQCWYRYQQAKYTADADILANIFIYVEYIPKHGWGHEVVVVVANK